MQAKERDTGRGAKRTSTGRKDQHPSQEGPRRMEWVIGFISAAIFIGLVLFLFAKAIFEPTGRSPEFAFDMTGPERAGDFWRLEFTAANVGTRTAAGVEIEGRLLTEGMVVETHSVTLDFLPAESEREAAFIFTNDPQGYDFDIRVTGYRDP